MPRRVESKKGTSGRKSRKARKTGKAASATKKARARSGLKRVASAVKSAIKRVARKVTAKVTAKVTRRGAGKARATAPPARARKPAPARPARRVKPDIPIEKLETMYIPHQTSLKTSFRSDGAERQRDQEFAGGVADDRWKDEDVYTNRSGDPRIGTHRRTYEPGEKAARAKSDEKE